MRRAWLLALTCCAHASPRGPAGFGLSRSQAVPVCLPMGEQAYLRALRCPSGEAPQAKRLGSVGSRTPADADDPRLLQQMDPGQPLAPGEPDFHIVDAFEARCGPTATTLYLDMYHCPVPPPPLAADGFTLEE